MTLPEINIQPLLRYQVSWDTVDGLDCHFWNYYFRLSHFYYTPMKFIYCIYNMNIYILISQPPGGFMVNPSGSFRVQPIKNRSKQSPQKVDELDPTLVALRERWEHLMRQEVLDLTTEEAWDRGIVVVDVCFEKPKKKGPGKTIILLRFRWKSSHGNFGVPGSFFT